MILHAVLALLAAVVLALGTARVALPAIHRAQHRACLARIDVLERELGIAPSAPMFTARRRLTPADLADAWNAGIVAANYRLPASLESPRPPSPSRRDDDQKAANRRARVEVAELYEQRRRKGVSWWPGG